MSFPFSSITRELIKQSLSEDLGSGDITTLGMLRPNATGSAVLVAKADGILCGKDVFDEVFHLVDPAVRLHWKIGDGMSVSKSRNCAAITGSLQSILIAERTALNFTQRMSGIATLTREFTSRIAQTPCQILDTRKTTPLWRELEKYAVRMGGGMNHRSGLYDMFLIKENHISAAGGISKALQDVLAFREKSGLKSPIEIEVKDLNEVKEALNFPIERIMLDNMNLTRMREAVQLINHVCKVEASGGVTLETVKAIAETGVDFISVGSLTHSAPAMDLSLLISNAG